LARDYAWKAYIVYCADGCVKCCVLGRSDREMAAYKAQKGASKDGEDAATAPDEEDGGEEEEDAEEEEEEVGDDDMEQSGDEGN
jgi:hypothetical protein